ncbi:Zinc/iron permease [Dichotomopilus funicola]|uniref:Zinc/iron permease n=1 Tax=Dichotomopilus funicola TaxID=1934379 RepID=A0AAN6ZMW5_9PEZI|nr:Zinc/iron permease [Dichotomopilus funicola]
MAQDGASAVSDMDLMSGKPACGSGEEVGEYDLGLHVAALFLVLAASIFGAGFPVVAKKVKWVKVPRKTFFICKHFGTGVLIATAFVHLLPTAFGNLLDPCLPDLFTDQYPALPGVIMMASMFCLFIVEMWINSKLGGHTHGGPMGFDSAVPPAGGQVQVHHNRGAPPPRPPRYTNATDFEIDDIEDEKKAAQKMYDEKMRKFTHGAEDPYNGDDKDELEARSEMPPWFIVFYEQYVRQRLEMMNMIKSTARQQQRQQYQIENNTSTPDKRQTIITETALADSPYIDVETGQAVDPAVFRKMSLNITLLEGGILFHSVFVGMTVSITIEGFIVLLIAILFHQMFEGLGLGSRIAAVPYPKGSIRPWVLVVAFGTTAPLGQAIGLAVRDSYDPNSAFGLIIVGIFNAISSGLLLYAALVDLLAEDFLSEEAQLLSKKDRITAFVFVILGAMGMSIVGAFA